MGLICLSVVSKASGAGAFSRGIGVGQPLWWSFGSWYCSNYYGFVRLLWRFANIGRLFCLLACLLWEAFFSVLPFIWVVRGPGWFLSAVFVVRDFGGPLMLGITF